MMDLLKDLYVIAYQFARRVSPQRSLAAAVDYAKRVCIVSLVFIPLFVMTFVDVVLKIHVRNLVGSNRLELLGFAVIAVFAGYAVVDAWLRRIPELQTREGIERHYEQLPAGRKILVPCLAGAPLVGMLLLIAARQFLGWFGGL